MCHTHASGLHQAAHASGSVELYAIHCAASSGPKQLGSAEYLCGIKSADEKWLGDQILVDLHSSQKMQVCSAQAASRSVD